MMIKILIIISLVLISNFANAQTGSYEISFWINDPEIGGESQESLIKYVNPPEMFPQYFFQFRQATLCKNFYLFILVKFH